MILCHCAAVTDRTVARIIEEGARSVADVTRRCGAGRCCASCREEIAAMLYSAGAAAHIPATVNREPAASAAGAELR